MADKAGEGLFWDDHRKGMTDPEYAEAFVEAERRVEALQRSYEMKVADFAAETRKVEAVLLLANQPSPMVGMEGLGWDMAMKAVREAVATAADPPEPVPVVPKRGT